METLDCIKNRRSVRAFKDKEVSEALLYEVLESARWAPSSGNLQNIRILVVTDEKKKAVIAKAALDQRFIAEAPIVLVICSDSSAVVSHYGERGKNLYAIQNTAAAIQNILLAAYDRGLATCWVGAFTESRIRKELTIPSNIEIHAIIPLGYPAERPRAPPKIELADLVYFNKWEERKWPEEILPLKDALPRFAKKAVKKLKSTLKK